MERIYKKSFKNRKKTWVARYYDSRNFDWSCRHNGGCPWCIRNRIIGNIKLEGKSKELIDEYQETPLRDLLFGEGCDIMIEGE